MTGTFSFLRLGFGVQNVFFEEQPHHYCSLYYVDSRMLGTSLALESNSKACNIRSKTVEKKGFHWDSKSRVETKDGGLKTSRWRTGMQDFYTALTTDENDEPIEEPIIQPDDPDE